MPQRDQDTEAQRDGDHDEDQREAPAPEDTRGDASLHEVTSAEARAFLRLLALLVTTDVHISRGAGRRPHRLILPAGGSIGEIRAHLIDTLERALRG